jgi:sulfatase maturation enzyme AslB (radical SAM superfamily)
MLQLQVEPINVCNADCVFCPYGEMKRAKGKMSMELYKKIIDDAANLPLINHLTLTGLGETLLDPHIVERVTYARQKMMPGVLIDLYTNGSNLTNEKAEALAKAGLGVLYVSLNAVNADARRQIMRLNDFDKVKKYTRDAINIMEPLGTKVRVKTIVSKDLMQGEELEEFIKEWDGRHEDGGHAFCHLEGNWAGSMYDVRVHQNSACSRALKEIMVLSDGRVSLCCFDGEGQVILGDLNKQTIQEVYNSEKAFGIRKAHYDGRRGEIPICANCTGI